MSLDKDASRRGRRNIRAGKTWERWVRKAHAEAMPGLEAKRNFQFRGGKGGLPDVTCGGVFSLECKDGARPNVLRALEQAERDQVPGSTAVAVCHWAGTRKDRAVVSLRLGDWLAFVHEWWARMER